MNFNNKDHNNNSVNEENNMGSPIKGHGKNFSESNSLFSVQCSPALRRSTTKISESKPIIHIQEDIPAGIQESYFRTNKKNMFETMGKIRFSPANSLQKTSPVKGNFNIRSRWVCDQMMPISKKTLPGNKINRELRSSKSLNSFSNSATKFYVGNNSKTNTPNQDFGYHNVPLEKELSGFNDVKIRGAMVIGPNLKMKGKSIEPSINTPQKNIKHTIPPELEKNLGYKKQSSTHFNHNEKNIFTMKNNKSSTFEENNSNVNTIEGNQNFRSMNQAKQLSMLKESFNMKFLQEQKNLISTKATGDNQSSTLDHGCCSDRFTENPLKLHNVRQTMPKNPVYNCFPTTKKVLNKTLAESNAALQNHSTSFN